MDSGSDVEIRDPSRIPVELITFIYAQIPLGTV